MSKRASAQDSSDGWVRRSNRQTRQPHRLGNLVSHDEIQERETIPASSPSDPVLLPEIDESTLPFSMQQPEIVSNDLSDPKECEELSKFIPSDVIDECRKKGIAIEYDRKQFGNRRPTWNRPRPRPRPRPRHRPRPRRTLPAFASDADTANNAFWGIVPPLVPNLPTETSTEFTVDSSDAIVHVPSPETDPKPLPETSRSRWVTALIQLQRYREELGITSDDDDGDDDDLQTWCWCQRGDIGSESVKCGNPDCTTGWYHKPCLNVHEQWFFKQYELWMCTNCMIPKWKAILAEERAARVAVSDKLLQATPAPMDAHVHAEPAADSHADIGEGTTPSKHDTGADTASLSSHHTVRNSAAPHLNGADNIPATCDEVNGSFTPAARTNDALADTSIHVAPHDVHEASVATSTAGDQDGDLSMDDWSENVSPKQGPSASSDTSPVAASNHEILVDNMAAQAVHQSRTIIDLTEDDDEQPPRNLIDLTQDDDDHEAAHEPRPTAPIEGGGLHPARPSSSITNTFTSSHAHNLPTSQALQQFASVATVHAAPLPVPAPRPGAISMSVHNITSLQASARMWTSNNSSVRPPREGPGISLRYKHGQQLPVMSAEREEPRYVLVPSYSSRGVLRGVEVPVKILNFFSGTLRGVNGCENLAFFAAGPVGTVSIPQADLVLVRNVVDFLKGEFLFVALSLMDIQTTARQKEVLLTYAHIAHLLGIDALMKAALHALYVSVLRRPQDWADLDDNQRVLEEFTFSNNPARRLLSGGRQHSILPNVTGEAALPCEEGRRREICDVGSGGARVLGTWGPPLDLVLAPGEDEEGV
ncbi:hypothetical protein EDD37DRAFT_488741 [Exophiala viscosa]|uniref:uncharacterized protein n=1 Tax=Exophiala viscosa TaxID=2486360 RepID=UPI00219A741A|nr:hypothetical protein EDD37DRAFT_488741 [Exophiala viscosa]